MKKRLFSTLLAGVLFTAAIIPVSAASLGVEPVPDGTDVYAGVTVDAEGDDAKIRVTVPTLFAFVASGTTQTSNTDMLSVDKDTILVPNYSVDVLNEDINNGDYTVGTTGSPAFKFSNYSTKSDGSTGREGIPVSVTGYIENRGSDASRNYWEHVDKITYGSTTEGNADQFKKYLVNVDGKTFSKTDGSGKFYMDGSVDLAAPSAATVDSNRLATSPATKDVNFSVEVGGQRGQYNQVEQSAKVGTIVWTASYKIANNGNVETAPANPYATPQP